MWDKYLASCRSVDRFGKVHRAVYPVEKQWCWMERCISRRRRVASGNIPLPRCLSCQQNPPCSKGNPKGPRRIRKSPRIYLSCASTMTCGHPSPVPPEINCRDVDPAIFLCSPRFSLKICFPGERCMPPSPGGRCSACQQENTQTTTAYANRYRMRL